MWNLPRNITNFFINLKNVSPWTNTYLSLKVEKECEESDWNENALKSI